MSSTPVNNLTQGHFNPSSLTPGVSGESVNAHYGPKAVDECGIESILSGEYNLQKENRALHGMDDFDKGKISGLAEPEKDQSMLKP